MMCERQRRRRETCVLDLAAPIPPIDPSKGAKGQRSGISWTRWITADFPSRMFRSTPSAVGVVVPGRIDVDIPWICMSLSAPKGQGHTRQMPRPPPTTSATTYTTLHLSSQQKFGHALGCQSRCVADGSLWHAARQRYASTASSKLQAPSYPSLVGVH